MADRATRAACHIGTSGWVYAHWRGVFYPWHLPGGQWLQHYATRFATVELNTSFYRLPSEGAFRRWQEDAPAGFTYAVKASRYITHMKKLGGVEKALPPPGRAAWPHPLPTPALLGMQRRPAA